MRMNSGLLNPDEDELGTVEVLKPPKEAAYYAAKVERMKKKIIKLKERRKIANISSGTRPCLI